MFSKVCFFLLMVLLASYTCHVVKIQPRIAGGFGVHVNRIPWQVSVQYEGGHRCGGSIINKNWILTSAFCTSHIQNIADTFVRFGTVFHDFGDVSYVKKIVQHPNFDEQSGDYDFALLELKDAIKFDNSSQPIKLPEFGERFEDGRNCLVSGWGDTLDGEVSPAHLRAVVVPLINQEKCSKAYKDYHRHPTPQMICAGAKNVGPCFGDLGGPLVVFDKEPWTEGHYQNAKLVGIVSWSKSCADAKFPDVYSRVDTVRDWIKIITGA